MPKRGRPPKGFTISTDLPELLDLWNRATSSPAGIAIQSERPNRLAQKLYHARRECGHNAYDAYAVIECETEVWIQPR